MGCYIRPKPAYINVSEKFASPIDNRYNLHSNELSFLSLLVPANLLRKNIFPQRTLRSHDVAFSTHLEDCTSTACMLEPS